MEENPINRIKELLNSLDVGKRITLDEFERGFLNASINEIKEELWLFYCFAVDVNNVVNR